MRRRCYGLLVIALAMAVVESADILLQSFQEGSMTLLGDAFLRNGSIELTSDSSQGRSSGRALFPSPIRLVDRASNATASFNTSFTFSIASTDAVHFGDGLAFILAPSNTTQGGAGGWLGFLASPPAAAAAGTLPTTTTQQHSFAVEFDTFLNVEFMDPNDNHVGVDVDSMVSLEFADAGSERVELKSGRPITAWIQYDSGRQEIEVSLSYDAGQMPQKRLLSLSVNLYAVLDEYMFVGFSAATGGNIELHSLHSWEFSSSGLQDHVDARPPPAAAAAAAAPPDLSSENRPEEQEPPRCNRKLCMAATTRFLAVSTASAIAGAVIVSMILWLTCSSRANHRHDHDFGGSKPSRVCSCLFVGCFRRGKQTRSSSDALSKKVSRISSSLRRGPTRFTFKELSCATKGFSPAKVLGYGAFGTVYKGRLRLPVDENSELSASAEVVEVEVAVKRANRGSKHGREEFMSELSIIGCLRHRNLVQLQGWCREKGELLLVYDYMPNGSLDKLLFDKSGAAAAVLKWSVRFKVVVGIGSALAYLHSEWEQQVVHRDVKASNIMLDASMNARLGDFGLARLMEHDSSPETTITAGTVGYLAPEYLHTGKATDKTDVFSFGIVALEVASGRRPIAEEEAAPEEIGSSGESSSSSSSHSGSSRVLVDWVWGLHRHGKIIQAADPKLGGEFEQVEMLLLLQVGLLCCHPDPTSRPSMKQAVQILCGETTIPPLPKAKPRPSFASLPPVSIEDIIQE